MIKDKELLHGNKLLFIYRCDSINGGIGENLRSIINSYTLVGFNLIGSRYDKSWDLLHEVIDMVNAKGKAYNFSIFKTYLAMSVEKDSKYFKDFHFAHSEYVTSEQTGKEACFRLLVKYLEWEEANKLNIE